MAGSLIGAAFTPAQKSEGPRLSDLTVGSSAYGTALPYLEGSARMSGQVVWASAKRELATTTSQGKGGGAETTSYSYEIDLFILLTDNEIADVTRIWSNGKLIWSIADGVSPATLEASGNTNRWSRMTVYNGNASQLPDPDYEAAVGTANAPAYRGRGTVFIKSLGLGSIGMLPNLTFEVSSQGIAGGSPSGVLVHSGGKFVKLDYETGALIETYPLEVDGVIYDEEWLARTSVQIPNTNKIWSIGFDVWLETPDNPPDPDLVIVAYEFDAGIGAYTRRIANLPGQEGHCIKASPDGQYIYYSARDLSSIMRIRRSDGLVSTLATPSYNNSSFWDVGDFEISPDGSKLVSPFWINTDYGVYERLLQFYDAHTGAILQTVNLGEEEFDFWEMRFSADGARLHVAWDKLFVLDMSSYAVLHILEPSFDDYYWNRFGAFVFNQDETVMYLGYAQDGRLDYYSLPSYTYVKTIFLPLLPNGEESHFQGMTMSPDSKRIYVVDAWDWNAWCYDIETEARTPFYFRPRYGTAAAIILSAGNPTSLSEVVRRLCIRAGLSNEQFDVSALASITLPVQSMAITQVSSARTILETLASCYFFEAVLSDKIYFRPRGGASVATLPFADLATANDVNAKTEPLPLKQTNALEIPAQMALTHSNILNDYLPDTQWSDRLLTGQENTSAVQVPLGFEPSQAKAITDSLLLDKVVSGLQTSFSVPRSYAELEPTDVVVVQDEDGSSYRLRLMRKKEADGVLTFDAVLDDVSILSQSGTTSSTATGQTEVAAVPDTALRLLDCPLLTDLDDSPGHYLALSAQASPWSGAGVYASWDNINFAIEASLTSQTVLGSCTSVLGAWAQGDQMDESNWFTVSVVQGELASVSREVLLADRSANAALVGAELLQFQNALLLSPGVYRLSGLLRGRRGTEYAQASHGAAEDFVLLGGSGLLHVALQSGDLGRTRYYKGVTAGQRVSAVTAQSLSLAGVSSRCLSPVNARANRDSADTVLTWTRRTRYSTRLTGALSINAPLGEVSEAYEIEVYSSSAFSSVLRTLSSSSPSVSYSLAQQLVDFGSAPSVLYLRLYQLSATTGRGYALQATL